MSFGSQVLFEDMNCIVNTGEKIGLVGRNGTGKSTLFKLIIGETKQESGAIDIPTEYTVGHLEQHLNFTQDSILKEACLGLPKWHEGEDWRAEKILSGLGFSAEDMFAHPDSFSGGFQIRLNLAKILVSEPSLLLLDEPTNYLDISSIRWLAKFLKNWDGELMLITHDRNFMNSVTTHTMIIHRNKSKKIKGGTDKLYEQIATEEEIYEKARVNDEKKRAKVQAYIDRFRSKASLASKVQSRIKALDKQEVKDKLDSVRTLDFEFSYLPANNRELLEALNINFSYPDGEELIRDFSIKVENEDRICVIGKMERVSQL